MCKHVSPETGCPLLRSSAPVLGLSQKYNPAFPVVGNEINGDLLRRHGSISNTELLWRPFYPYLRTVHDRASPHRNHQLLSRRLAFSVNDPGRVRRGPSFSPCYSKLERTNPMQPSLSTPNPDSSRAATNRA